ncbi:putative receptor-like protein kinase At2g23200 [Bidens hawaiensis]|uniref:putative receptor-like protein kinase At2g23200 n=1 Tax=Bidens hawaiensis TaxID=980011 RepID=UPI00404AD58D
MYQIGLDTTGTVYRAKLDHFGSNSLLATEGKNKGESSNKCMIVAIKHITSRDGTGQGKKKFFEEFEMRTSYKHVNIVSLLGFCDEGDEMILVYESLPEITLDAYLKNVNKIDSFTWTRRLHMCLEIARGLNHLHTMIVNTPRIIHIDIKSANILLDKNQRPKIGYFVISNSRPDNQEIGMKVYVDPEYETTGQWKREYDVYSFGVILFEILCGKVAYDPVYLKENDKGLAPIAHKCSNDGTIHRIMDPKLKEETSEGIFTSPDKRSETKFLKIASLCLEEAVKRPTLDLVIEELESALNFQVLRGRGI